MLAATLPTTTPFGPPALRPVLVQPPAARRLHAFGNELDLVLTRAALSAWFGTIPPDNGPPPHVHHREAEIIVVLDGALDFFVGALPDVAELLRVADAHGMECLVPLGGGRPAATSARSPQPA